MAIVLFVQLLAAAPWGLRKPDAGSAAAFIPISLDRAAGVDTSRCFLVRIACCGCGCVCHSCRGDRGVRSVSFVRMLLHPRALSTQATQNHPSARKRAHPEASSRRALSFDGHASQLTDGAFYGYHHDDDESQVDLEYDEDAGCNASTATDWRVPFQKLWMTSELFLRGFKGANV
eukprot:6213810-Pleurochrysis_carterae.AAC.2